MTREEILKAVLPKNAKEYTRAFITIAVNKLTELDVLDDSDIGAIRMLSVNYEMYVQASDQLIKFGPLLEGKHGEMTVNPANKLVKDYGSQIFVLLKEFGLTVKSRDLIGSMTPAVDEDNPLMEFAKRKNARRQME